MDWGHQQGTYKGYFALTGILRRRQGPTLTELVGGSSEGEGKDIPMAKAVLGSRILGLSSP